MNGSKIHCACVSAEARDCFKRRYQLELSGKDDLLLDIDDDLCECACHEIAADEDL